MAELVAAGAVDMAVNAGLRALSGAHVITRSGSIIQLFDQDGRVQLVTGSFTYDAAGALTGGGIAAIDGAAHDIAGLDFDVDRYGLFMQAGDVFGLRMALFAGDDRIQGSGGADRLLGFDGDDLVEGGFGADDLNGNRGADTVDGGDGADTIHGGRDDDLVFGGAGDDLATGSLGRDTVSGGQGDDLVYGGQGNDLLRGGEGDDHLSGDIGNDVLYGDDGADRFFVGSGAGADAIEDFDPVAGDRIVVERFVNGTDIAEASDLLPRIRLHPDGQLLDLGDGNVLLIRNYPGGEVSADHFLVL